MRIYLAGAKDDRLDLGCLDLIEEEETYLRLFSFFNDDLSHFVEMVEGRDVQYLTEEET